ncbi:hypothetical protein [uncultured Treponema sp.]|uniref:hypothetical protein n=1 Tax=uncultured Treponema sp. TaxID=162155 RepID=UPI002583775E|nr:hypothetical protein [uncultured Treponema sp.]
MVCKFYDIVYVGKSFGEYLKHTISENEVLRDELIVHLAKRNMRGTTSVAVWFDAPYDALNPERQLVNMYKNRVFSDNHKETSDVRLLLLS